MIQIITDKYTKKNLNVENNKYVVSDFKSPKSFDEYEINVIDLSFDKLWRKDSTEKMDNINMSKDFLHYKKIIENTQNTKVLIIFPQNIRFFSYYYNDKYHRSEDLKNLLQLVKDLVRKYINLYDFDLVFESTKTMLNSEEINADFYFYKNNLQEENIVLISDKSKKVTTIKVDSNLFYTTLDISNSPEKLEEFLLKTQIIDNEENNKPEWLKEVNILDDIEIKNRIYEIDECIKNKQIEKSKEIEKQRENEKIKSILYETNKNLQNEVIEILNEILDYQDDNFIDEMEEDFRIKKENVTFIIETKGLSRNIKGEDISKTVNHVEVYLDKLDEEDIKENVKGIYIVATQRKKKIVEREKTPDRQVKLAERNNILIIRTEQLLEIIEDYRRKKLKTEDIIKIFTEQIGELKYEKR